MVLLIVGRRNWRSNQRPVMTERAYRPERLSLNLSQIPAHLARMVAHNRCPRQRMPTAELGAAPHESCFWKRQVFAAHARKVSGAQIPWNHRKFVRHFKGHFLKRHCKFESSMPSHPVRSPALNPWRSHKPRRSAPFSGSGIGLHSRNAGLRQGFGLLSPGPVFDSRFLHMRRGEVCLHG